jgi:hypothetical protein
MFTFGPQPSSSSRCWPVTRHPNLHHPAARAARSRRPARRRDRPLLRRPSPRRRTLRQLTATCRPRPERRSDARRADPGAGIIWVAQLADHVRINAAGEAPAWAAQPQVLVSSELIADVKVWRAATLGDPGDLRPTGPRQLSYAIRIWQQQLDLRLAAADTHTDRQWRQLLATAVPSATADPFSPALEERLSNLARAGFDAALLVRSAAATGRTPSQRPGARRGRHWTSSEPCRARHRLSVSARVAETPPSERSRRRRCCLGGLVSRGASRQAIAARVLAALHAATRRGT